MKNKITLQVIPPKVSERHLLNKRDFGSFVVGAEEDYILARILLWIGMNDPAIYHYQQAVEKYLKAYLIQKKQQFRDTHDLEKLAVPASKFDKFFADQEFLETCKNLTHFEEVGRYPQVKIRSYGWVLPDILYFLDEYIFEMRKRINHEGILDRIEDLKKGSIGLGSDYFTEPSQLIDLFYKDNQYFKRGQQ